jgi:hypothetical protein
MQLNRRHTNQQPIVVNGIAASSWGAENILAFYTRFGPFPGNTAWIVQSTHDMVDVINSEAVIPYVSEAPFGAVHDFTLSAWRWLGPRLPQMRESQERKVPTVSHERMRERADKALYALITALKLDHDEVNLVFHATRTEALTGESEGLSHYQTIAEAKDVKFISTMELYRQAYAAGNEVHYDDIHFSGYGASLLAEYLSAQMSSEK